LYSCTRRRRPVLFYSRKLLPAEMNYSTPDKELLTIVQVLKKHPHYLRGTKYPVIIRSDHRNLRTFMTTKELSARQARWAEELCTYNFVIEHIKGKQNTVADALSRNPSLGETPPRTAEVLCEDGKLLMNRNIQLKTVQVEWNNPNFQKKLLEETKKEERDPSTPIDELILVPRNMKQQVISRFHEEMSAGHQGESRTMEKIQREFYFPGMTRKVRSFIKCCDNCQKNKNRNRLEKCKNGI
jgi:RNase H-like domain found in reverse transcriptase/Integrase zinc binding domain